MRLVAMGGESESSKRSAVGSSLSVRVGVPPKVLDIHCRVEAPRDALLGKDDGRAGGLETGLPLSEGLLVGP